MTATIDVATVRGWLADGGEIAFLDVREEGQHGSGHPLLAVNVPYSRLEAEIVRLVPRRSCRVVLLDDDDGVAAKAERRLAGLGYRDIHALSGGAAGWSAAGYPLFPSTNVQSKGFAEIIEHEFATPAISAEELDRLRRSGAKVTVLDSRPLEEYARFHVPGAVPCPGAELVHRFADLVPSPETLVVVSCAGRTRGIIGAQSLIDAGVPNRVMSLAGGTQGWRLAGLELESGLGSALGPVNENACASARRRADAVAARFGVRSIDHPTLAAWLAEADRRTTYVLDVRTPEEFAAGHLPGAVSAPGGQLVQAIDRWVGTRGARLVLVDDTATRAIMTTHWLVQMGWDVRVLDDASAGAGLETGHAEPKPAALPAVPEIEVREAARLLAEGAAAISLDPSAAYRASHPQGAVWANRARFDRLPAPVLAAQRIVLFAEDETAARLAAIDLAELTAAPIALVRGGASAWRRGGLPVVASPDQPPDDERIDYLFWNHDRHSGNAAAMRAYLRWETELPEEIAADGLSGFRIAAP
ncbi:MAG TPA: rhodanese-like domain-containing protein [Stellaceae bacterium]|nr:rhodanese-like domain-containing protein [Stellaceae bacterium]